MGPRLDTGGWLILTKIITDLLSTGSFTLQDTPSFARRDNGELRGQAFKPKNPDKKFNFSEPGASENAAQ